MKKFRVLSLDGGGVRGYLTAMILENIEKHLNKIDDPKKPLGEYFDLIAGTSTGAIIGGLLAIGKRAEEIRKLYERDLKEIFSEEMLRQGQEAFTKAKYSKKILRQKAESEEYFGSKTFSFPNDVKTHLLVTAVDITTMTPRFYKSPYNQKNIPRSDEKLADAIIASASAPAYFPIQEKLKYSSNLIDGGIVANNPSLIAFIDALTFDEKPDHKDIVLLSIGTGKICEIPYEIDPLKDGSIDWLLQINKKKINEIFNLRTVMKLCTNWLLSKCGTKTPSYVERTIPLIEIIMNSQSSLVEFQMDFLMKSFKIEKQYKRINPNLGIRVELDDVEKIENLKNLADLDEETTKWIIEYLGG